MRRRRTTSLGREEELLLVASAAGGDRDAVGSLLHAHLPLVVREARGHLGRGVPLDDLVGEGCFGLVEAIGRFDPGRNVRFMTYAIWWVRRRLVLALSTQGRNVRIPRRTLAAAAARHARGEAPAPLLREVPLQDAVESDALAALRDPSPSPEAQAALTERRELARAALRHLPQRDRGLLALRFGLSGEEPLKLPELALIMGISKERVRQLEQRALERLRAVLTAAPCEDAAPRVAESASLRARRDFAASRT